MKGAGGRRRGWEGESPNRAAWKRSERGRRGRGGARSRAKTLKQVNRSRMKAGSSGWQTKEFLKCRGNCPHPSL